MRKTTLIYLSFVLFIIVGIAATPTPQAESACKNCKVIPKNVDEDQIERIMYKMSRDLSVTCTYCHPDTRSGTPIVVDFETDSNPKKIIARNMMIMTDNLNRKYFKFKNLYDFASFKKTPITCGTCHQGLTKPNNTN